VLDLLNEVNVYVRSSSRAPITLNVFERRFENLGKF